MTQTRHEEISDRLIEDILRGQYRVGERLPSERDLASRFGANRGAAREAVKKLEQLGLAQVQPGGARVCAIEESSLDILGYLMKLEEYPDPQLVEQMMEVMEALISVAVRRMIRGAADAQIDEARKFIADALEPGIPIDQVLQARMNLWRHFMRMSGNLVLALIGRSLRVQFGTTPDCRKAELMAKIDTSVQDQCLRWLDKSLAERDEEGALSAFQRLAKVNKRLMLPVLEAARREAEKFPGKPGEVAR